VEALQGQVDECQTKLWMTAQDVEEQKQHLRDRGAPWSYQADLQSVLEELQAECEARCRRDAELHERLGREASMLAERLEKHRMAFAENLADILKHVDLQVRNLDTKCNNEHKERCQDGEELRAILNSMWLKASPEPSGRREQKVSFEDRRLLDDSATSQQDVRTVYEMVCEALGDIVHLRQQLAAEKESRKQEQQGMERQVRTIKALLHDAKEVPCKDSPQL